MLSATDLARNPRTGRIAIDDKLAFYRSHAWAEYILMVAQDITSVAIHLRDEDGAWRVLDSRQSEADAVDLPRLGSIGTVADLCQGVRL